jgi:hypothetical protein
MFKSFNFYKFTINISIEFNATARLYTIYL